jgi:hypothetical protein
MGDQVRGHIAVNPVDQHQSAQDDKDTAHHPAGQFDADEHAHDGKAHVRKGLSPCPVVDGFEHEDPVSDGGHRSHDQKIVHPADFCFGFVQQEDQNVGNDDIHPPVVLCGHGLHHSRPGVEKTRRTEQRSSKICSARLSFSYTVCLPVLC